MSLVVKVSLVSPKSRLLCVVASLFLSLPAMAEPASASADSAQENAASKGTLASPRLELLKKEIEARSRVAIDTFWQEIAKEGAPLVEAIKGDDRNLLVTFLWREKKDTRVIINNDFSKSVYQMQMTRLLDTDIWYKTYRMRNDARFFYQFSVFPQPARLILRRQLPGC